MEVVTEEQHRVLSFVATANAGGYEPTAQEIEAWLSHPRPRDRWNTLGSATRLAMLGFGGSESSVEHLSTLGWLTAWIDRYSLTKLGAALLRGAEQADAGDVQVVVLGREDPLAYPTLIGHLAEAGDALLVDPYLDVNGAADLISHTQIKRVLVNDASGTRGKRAALATLLSTELGQDFEVRSAPSLHDRFVISDDGGVWTVGASLNGVGRRATTVVTPLPSAAAEAVAAEMQEAWDNAQPLLNRSVETDEGATG